MVIYLFKDAPDVDEDTMVERRTKQISNNFSSKTNQLLQYVEETYLDGMPLNPETRGLLNKLKRQERVTSSVSRWNYMSQSIGFDHFFRRSLSRSRVIPKCLVVCPVFTVIVLCVSLVIKDSD